MCSLQEAYNVPHFGGPQGQKKPRRCAPPAAPASADPYDPYFPEAGRGGVAAVPPQQQRAPAPPRYGREDFLGDVPRSAAAPPSAVRIGDRDKVTYKGMANDYQYYKEYGVDLPKIEGFQSPAALNSAYLLPGTDAPTSSGGPFPAQGNRAGFPSRAPGAAGTCAAPAAQRYEIPISAEARRAYDAAFATAIGTDDPIGSTRAPRPEMRRADMSGVTGYYDPDLENYLETADLNATSQAPLLTQPRIPVPAADTTGPYDPRASPFSAALQKFGAGRPETVPESQAPADHSAPAPPAPRARTSAASSAPADSWQGIWEILLFVIAGILVIFLCEQLFKLAVMVGMRQTMDLLEPYLDKLTALK